MMNEHDQRMNITCNFPEKDAIWYSQHFKKPNEKPEVFTSPCTVDDTASNTISRVGTEKLVERDHVLKNILTISSKNALVVSKHYFHDVLLTEKDSFRELQKNKTTAETKLSGISVTAEVQKVKRKLNFQVKGTPKKERKRRRGPKF